MVEELRQLNKRSILNQDLIDAFDELEVLEKS
jgi:hypothetical protein